MFRNFFVTLMALFMLGGSAEAADTKSQQQIYKAVFHVTTDNPKIWEAIISNVQNVLIDLGPQTQIEIVAHNNGIEFLKSVNHKDMSVLEKLKEQGVVFLACENTMKRKNIEKKDLLPFSGTVSSGVAHIIKRQAEGWAYIRTPN